MTRADVLVLGGGAAGLAAGIAAARAGARVCLVEKLPRVGKRLLATGNGRCNLTNTGARAADYFGDGAFAAGALARFSPEAVRAFFREIGLESREEYGGRVFPRSNQAAAVVDALRLAFAEAGGETVADFAAIALEPQRGGFCARAADGRAVWGKSAVCALGGMAAPALGRPLRAGLRKNAGADSPGVTFQARQRTKPSLPSAALRRRQRASTSSSACGPCPKF